MMSITGLVERASRFGFAGRVLRWPLRLVPQGTEVPVLGGINRGKRWIAGASTTNSTWIGTYERDHAGALAQFVRPGMIVYDIGANVGFYSLALSGLVGESGRVYAFEPEARNAYMLHRHIEMNHLQNVTLVQAAVSDVVGLVGFGGNTEHAHIARGSAYQIPAITLDEFIGAGNPQPSFIKMDIEGGECAALEAGTSILSKGEAVWMMATHAPELRTRCCEILAGYGYRFVGFDCKSDPGDAPDFLAIPTNLMCTAKTAS